MDLFTLALILAGGSALAVVSALLWLAARRRGHLRAMANGEAGLFATRPAFGERGGTRWFGGKAKGVEWTVQISTDDLLTLVRTGQWRDAAPWLLLGGGAASAFASWPFLMLQLIGVDGRLAAIVALALLVVAIRTAWPRPATPA